MTNWLLEKHSERKSRIGLVMIEFVHVPIDSPFRYHRRWWKKINFKTGCTYLGQQIEIDEGAPVGMLLSDLSEVKRSFILKE